MTRKGAVLQWLFTGLFALVLVCPQASSWAGTTNDQSFGVTVDYNQGIGTMLMTSGCYPMSHDINDQTFPTHNYGLAKIKFVLVPLDRQISISRSADELEFRRVRPATLCELLAFERQYPHQASDRTIVALGSADERRGYHFVPYTYGTAGGARFINLLFLEMGLNDLSSACRSDNELYLATVRQ